MVSILAENNVKFYETSFDCSKVKQDSVEYKICSDEKLSNLDRDLSNVYLSIDSLSEEIKSDQKSWKQQRNKCEDSDCIKLFYILRLNELNTIHLHKDNFFIRAYGSITNLFKYGFSSKGYQEFNRKSQDSDIRFGRFSADGTKVLLNYRPIIDGNNRSYMGILNIIDNSLTLFNPPKNYYLWYDGSFSPNTNEILFSFTENTKSEQPYGLGLLNLNNMTYKVIIKSETPMKSASFSSDASHIIYVGVNVDKYNAENIKRGKFSFDILELNIKTKVIKSLTDITFITASSPQYYLDDKYIFSAEGAYVGKGHSLFKGHMEKYKNNDTYILSLKKIVKTAVPAIIRGTNTQYVDISEGAKKILCISLNKEPKYNYELFMHEDGEMKQLTNMKSMIIDAALSPDAMKAVFVSDFSRQGERKIWQLNIDKNELSQIKLNSGNIIWKSIKKDK